MKGLHIEVLYDPDDPVGCADLETLIEPLADHMMGLELYGSFRVLEFDEEGAIVRRGILRSGRKKTGPGLFEKPKKREDCLGCRGKSIAHTCGRE